VLKVLSWPLMVRIDFHRRQPHQVTTLLKKWSNGDEAALAQLMQLVQTVPL
jgi:hypothetical protein